MQNSYSSILLSCAAFVFVMLRVPELGQAADPGPAPIGGYGVDVRAFGAKGDGVTDDTNAIKAAIASRPGGRATIYLPSIGPGYLVTDTLLVSHDRMNFVGDGKQATVIMFAPTSPKPLFRFANGRNSVYQCSIRGLGIGGTNATQKTAVEAIDVREFNFEDVAIYPFTGGGKSIGLHIAGRELVRVVNVSIHADRPIVISANANNGISLDHSHFEDVYLIAADAQPCIQIESGVNLSNVTFDGSQAWVGGTYGLYWNDTTSSRVSWALRIDNLRREQSKDPSAYSIYISHHAGLQALYMNNVFTDVSQNGVFLAGTRWSSIDHLVYPGKSQAIAADAASNEHLVIQNSFFQRGSTTHPATPRSAGHPDGWWNGELKQ